MEAQGSDDEFVEIVDDDQEVLQVEDLSDLRNSEQQKSSIKSEYKSEDKDGSTLSKIQELNRIYERKDLLVVKDYKLYRFTST